MTNPIREASGPDPSRARAAVLSLVESPLLDRFLDEPQGFLPVGVFDDEVRQWLGAETQMALLPAAIVHKQSGRWQKRRQDGQLQYRDHGFSAREYRLLPGLIGQPQLVMRYLPARRITRERLALRLNLLSEIDACCYNTVLARFPNDPTRTAVISFHEIEGGRTQVGRMIARARTGEDGQAVFRSTVPWPEAERDCAW